MIRLWLAQGVYDQTVARNTFMIRVWLDQGVYDQTLACSKNSYD